MGGLPDWRDITHSGKVEIVRDLAERGLSGSQIAGNFVGATRSAVLGFCRRNGIRLKGVPVRLSAPAEKPRPKPKPRVEPVPVPVLEPEPEPEPELNATALFAPEQPSEDAITVLAGASAPMVYMAAVDARRCLWPLWDRFEGPYVSLCCGAERVLGRPYCKEHVSASAARTAIAKAERVLVEE